MPGGEDLKDLLVEFVGDPASVAIDVAQVTQRGWTRGAAPSSGAQYTSGLGVDVLVDIGVCAVASLTGASSRGTHREGKLTPAHTPLPIEFTALQLIRARHAIVPFQEDPEIQQLRTWATRMPEEAARMKVMVISLLLW